MRQKPWNMCQEFGCRRSTKSREREREVEKRWCGYHMPGQIKRDNILKDGDGRLTGSKCVLGKKRKCVVPKITFSDFMSGSFLSSGVCLVSSTPSPTAGGCLTPSVRCVDPDLRFKVPSCQTSPPIETKERWVMETEKKILHVEKDGSARLVTRSELIAEETAKEEAEIQAETKTAAEAEEKARKKKWVQEQLAAGRNPLHMLFGEPPPETLLTKLQKELPIGRRKRTPQAEIQTEAKAAAEAEEKARKKKWVQEQLAAGRNPLHMLFGEPPPETLLTKLQKELPIGKRTPRV